MPSKKRRLHKNNTDDDELKNRMKGRRKKTTKPDNEEEEVYIPRPKRKFMELPLEYRFYPSELPIKKKTTRKTKNKEKQNNVNFPRKGAKANFPWNNKLTTPYYLTDVCEPPELGFCPSYMSLFRGEDGTRESSRYPGPPRFGNPIQPISRRINMDFLHDGGDQLNIRQTTLKVYYTTYMLRGSLLEIMPRFTFRQLVILAHTMEWLKDKEISENYPYILLQIVENWMKHEIYQAIEYNRLPDDLGAIIFEKPGPLSTYSLEIGIAEVICNWLKEVQLEHPNLNLLNCLGPIQYTSDDEDICQAPIKHELWFAIQPIWFSPEFLVSTPIIRHSVVVKICAACEQPVRVMEAAQVCSLLRESKLNCWPFDFIEESYIQNKYFNGITDLYPSKQMDIELRIHDRLYKYFIPIPKPINSYARSVGITWNLAYFELSIRRFVDARDAEDQRREKAGLPHESVSKIFIAEQSGTDGEIKRQEYNKPDRFEHYFDYNYKKDRYNNRKDNGTGMIDRKIFKDYIENFMKKDVITVSHTELELLKQGGIRIKEEELGTWVLDGHQEKWIEEEEEDYCQEEIQPIGVEMFDEEMSLQTLLRNLDITSAGIPGKQTAHPDVDNVVELHKKYFEM